MLNNSNIKLRNLSYTKKENQLETKHLFIVGFMASGKSTIGRMLARSVTRRFIDLDYCIEQRSQQSISQIFEEKGEAYFRHLECQTLKAMSYEEPSIIATGGGVPVYFDNMDFIIQNGHSVYLRYPIGILVGRLKANRHKRPLVAQLSDEELRNSIESKLKERAPFYEKAKLILDCESLSKNQITTAIKEYFYFKQ